MTTETAPRRPDRWLGREEYDQLTASAETYRETLLVRLAGESGLRAAEIVRVRPGDLRRVRSGPDRYLLAVRSDDGVDRETVVPPALEREISRYVRENGVGADEPMIAVSARRVQMIVSEVASRAADRTGDERYADLSVRDLRKYFARRLLVDADANPRVAKAVGGWGSFESLEPYLDSPDEDAVVAVLDDLADPESKRESDRLQRLQTVAEAVRLATEDALDAGDRSDVERAVCDALTGEAYVGAWFGAPGHATDAPPRAVDGVGEADATAMAEALSAAGVTERALAAESPVALTETDADSMPVGVRDALRECGAQSLALVPLTARETAFGVVCVLSDRATLDDDERAHLRTLGRQIGQQIASLRRRERLLSDAVVELEFRVPGDRSFFNRVASGLDCSLSLESLVEGSDAALVYYVTLSGATPPEVFEYAKAADRVDEFRLVETYDSGFLLEFVLSGSAPTLTLTRAGVTVTELDVGRGVTEITAELAPDADLRSVIDELTESFPAAEFVGKQRTDETDRTVGGFRRGVEDRLTDRQEAALRAAYFGGYFDWPRESTAEEIADAMGVSSPTLHSHLRKGQHELLQTVFETTAHGQD